MTPSRTVHSLVLSERAEKTVELRAAAKVTADDGGAPIRFDLHVRALPHDRQYMQQGQPLRLWHYDSSSFITGSSNDAKDRCYLRRIVDGDASSPESLSVKSIWAIEPAGADVTSRRY